MRISKLLLGGLAVSALTFAPLSGVAGAKPGPPPGHNKLTCFDGTHDGGFGGICKLKGKGAKGGATLDNRDNNPNGDYAGVYTNHSAITGKPLGQIKSLGYHYTGTVTPKPGDLSLNVPLDENNDGTTEDYAFVDAFYCPGSHGHVDIINDPNCGIYVGGVTFYPNWNVLVTAHPTWKVAKDHPPILIAERTPSEPPAFWKVDHVTFGK
jgi:hypothetical protein